jgi:hypothetical protein
MKFSTIALIGAAAAETARDTAAANLRAQSAEHFKKGVAEAVDTGIDVARIHKKYHRVVGQDFKQTLQREKRFWGKAPEIWQGYKDAYHFEEQNWQYTETATTGTWKLNNPQAVAAKWKAAYKANLENGRNIDTTGAGFLDRTIERRAAAKKAIQQEIRAGRVVVEREFSIA